MLGNERLRFGCANQSMYTLKVSKIWDAEGYSEPQDKLVHFLGASNLIKDFFGNFFFNFCTLFVTSKGKRIGKI